MNNIKINIEKYAEMTKYNNLISPIYLITNSDSNLIGYLMKYLDGYYTLSEFPISNEKHFYKIFNGICEGFSNILQCGFKPCTEHAGNIMILYDEDFEDVLDVVLIDLDDLKKCDDNNNKETLNQLNTIMNFNDEMLKSTCVQKYFDVDSEKNIKIKENDLNELIIKIKIDIHEESKRISK